MKVSTVSSAVPCNQLALTMLLCRGSCSPVISKITFKEIIRKNFGGIVAEIWEKMRDNLKVDFLGKPYGTS